MLAEFISVTSSENFDEDGWVQFQSAEWHGRELALNVDLEGSGIPRQAWRLVCSDVRTMRLDGQSSGTVELTNQHPLLWPHVGLQADLYFNGKPDNPQQVLGRILLALRALAGDWFTADEFLNLCLWSTAHQLVAAYGQFASGPLPVIERFRSELERSGSKCSILTKQPRFWNGMQWLDNQEELKVLIVGSSFVVMSKMDAQKI